MLHWSITTLKAGLADTRTPAAIRSLDHAHAGRPDNAMAVPQDITTFPDHVAIIMDGNGRWARRRGLRERVRGHEAGVDAVRDVTTAAAETERIAQLTLYAFSTENWQRPRREVAFLMRMLRRFLIEERPTIMNNAIRLTAIGELQRLPKDVRAELDTTRAMSTENDGMTLCLALSYGSRQELVHAAQALGARILAGELDPTAIDASTLAAHLYQPHMPDVDLLIRTAGELRVSNFLLWQNSYAEFYSTETLWPDFRRAQLYEALRAFASRERTFGGLTHKERAASAPEALPPTPSEAPHEPPP